MLEAELTYFKKIHSDLKEKHPEGGFAVIKDQELLGVWQDRQDALKEGIEKYGSQIFLVKNIMDDPDRAINYSREIFSGIAVSN